MKIECLREKLEAGITRAEKITGKNLSLPVLQCVLLLVKNSTLTIRATNLDLGLEVKIPVKTEKEGVVAVPAAVLKNFLGSLYGDKKVFLELSENTLIVKTSHSTTQIKTFPYEEFPSIPVVEGGQNTTLPGDKLLLGFKSVFYSASSSSMKPELASVYVYPDKGDLVFVATDSFRLAEKRIKIKGQNDFKPLLVPCKNVNEIIKVLEDNKEDVLVSFSDNQISFTQNSIYVTSRVVDGNFPDYAQIIPKEYATEITLLKQDFIGALRLSNLFADKFNQTTFEVDPEDRLFFIKTSNNEVGENTAQVDAAIEGDDIEISFNHRYVAECFQSISSDSLSLGLSSGKPMVITGIGDSSFLYLVMSMNK